MFKFKRNSITNTNNEILEYKNKILYFKNELENINANIKLKDDIIQSYINSDYNISNEINKYQDYILKLETTISNLNSNINEIEQHKTKLLNYNIELQKHNVELQNNIDEFNKYTCLLCLDKPKQILLTPCNHLIYCIDCFKLINSGKSNNYAKYDKICPLCRNNVISEINIYL